MRIDNVVVAGIVTDQRASSTGRSLADESFDVIVENCCAAATMDLHRHELQVIKHDLLPGRLARPSRGDFRVSSSQEVIRVQTVSRESQEAT
jgi:hypothetical protein